jgi:SSS family solute:Na+ symporter
MGGLYWKRATSSGAAASLCAGFVLQVALVLIDLMKTAPMAPPYLESIHPLFMGHGVIVAMAVSGCVFIVVSLATVPSKQFRLIPFFADERRAFTANMKDGLYAHSQEVFGIMDRIDVRRHGENVRLHLSVEMPGNILWKQLVAELSGSTEQWMCPAGAETVQRFGHGETLVFSCVTVTRGDNPSMLWFETEGEFAHLEQLKQEIYKALVDAETFHQVCRATVN